MRTRLTLAIVAMIAMVATGCGGAINGTPESSSKGDGTALCNKDVATDFLPTEIAPRTPAANQLSGAGATFPAPVYSAWASQYAESGGAKVAYQSIGSGGGIQQITAKTVDFGASDAPMKDEELAAAPGPILHIPTVVGAVVPTYNLAVDKPLKFDGATLGKIFAGKLTKWNDPALTALNPGVDLPAEDIVVVHRSDGSGTTAIFTDYLTKVSDVWTKALGDESRSKGKEVAWPTGLGGKGNEGVSATIGQTSGAIGYVELTFALEQNLAVGHVKNAAGKSIEPCINSVSAATKGADFPADLRFSLTNAAGPDAYPITGATWLLVYQNQTDQQKANALVNWLTWIMDSGEQTAAELHYAPLSAALRAKAIGLIKSITFNGKPVVS